MTKKLTDIFTAKDHQHMIDRYVKILNGGDNPQYFTQQELINKINWHTEQYLAKTGELPD